MKNFIKKIALIGSAVAAGFAIANRKKIKKEVDALVKKGKITAQEGKKLAAKLYDDVKKQAKIYEVKARSHAENIVKRANVVTKEKADAMQKKIRELEAKLKGKTAKAAKKKPSKKKPAKKKPSKKMAKKKK